MIVLGRMEVRWNQKDFSEMGRIEYKGMDFTTKLLR